MKWREEIYAQWSKEDWVRFLYWVLKFDGDWVARNGLSQTIDAPACSEDEFIDEFRVLGHGKVDNVAYWEFCGCESYEHGCDALSCEIHESAPYLFHVAAHHFQEPPAVLMRRKPAELMALLRDQPFYSSWYAMVEGHYFEEMEFREEWIIPDYGPTYLDRFTAWYKDQLLSEPTMSGTPIQQPVLF